MAGLGPRPRPRTTRLDPVRLLVACVAASQLILSGQVTGGASGPHAAEVVASSTGSFSAGSLLLPPPPALAAARALPVSARQKDEYDDDYQDDDDDYDDDYDSYGTKQKKKKKKKPGASQAAAAGAPIDINLNVLKFLRVFVLRIVWGVASMFGLDEPLSEAFNGAFVPPGVDVDDGDDLGFDY